MRMAKRIYFGERFNMDLIADMFNIANKYNVCRRQPALYQRRPGHGCLRPTAVPVRDEIQLVSLSDQSAISWIPRVVIQIPLACLAETREPEARFGVTLSLHPSLALARSSFPNVSTLTPTPRTRLVREADRAVYDREAVYRILDEGFLCHVGFVADGQPFVIPTSYGRKDANLYIHGSAASRMLRK